MSGDAASVAAALQAALLAAARGVAGLGVYDAPPTRGAVPHAVVEEPVLAAADAAGLQGRTGTVVLTWRDAGERPVRLRALIGAGEEAVAAMPRDLPGGWRIVGLRLARSRLAPTKGGWLGASEFAVRLYRLDG